MRSRHASAVAVAVAAAAVCLGATAANAKCQKLSFLVNDYGKEGPTRDAKNLLDKYIVDWTREKGIKNYTVGKKDVSCELFLDFIVFDEHTCTASAMVCWADGAPPAPRAAAPAAKSPATPAPKPPSAKKAQVPG
jgi:hypothetical protein